ncbi:MAG: hypothetical protein K2J71_00150 [Oscillospiraceae bacterium]|nr:hypothetical protein [Oscillospiraceae bacterium]
MAYQNKSHNILTWIADNNLKFRTGENLIMMKEQLWEVFRTTGKITDYLAYTNQKGNEQENYDDDDQRHCTIPESTG